MQQRGAGRAPARWALPLATLALVLLGPTALAAAQTCDGLGGIDTAATARP